MTTIELFGCAGGMALGFRRAGIELDWAFDWDDDACASYEANLGHRPVQMDARDVLRLVTTGWRPKTGLDLVVADPPCTPWSRAGKRLGQADERDMLGVTVAILDQLRPRAWLVANVPGLDDADHWVAVVQPVIGGFGARAGYCVDYASLDAANYGVPQRRIRPFWFGHPAGTPCLRWPQATHIAPPVLPGVGAGLPWVTAGQALAHLPGWNDEFRAGRETEVGRMVRLRWKKDTDHRPSEPSEPAKTLTANPNSDGAILRPHNGHPMTMVDRPAPTVRSGGDGHAAPQVILDRSRSRQNGKQIGSDPTKPARVVGADSRMHGNLLVNPRHAPASPASPASTQMAKLRSGSDVMWLNDRPATTVTQDPRIPPPGHHATGSYMNADGAFVLSERARAILQGFPDGEANVLCERCSTPKSPRYRGGGRWHFCAKTATARSSMIGMAMPAPMAEAVARSIARWFAQGMDEKESA